MVGERKQIDFAVDTKGRWMEEEIEVRIRNHKSESVDVLVKENLYRWTSWSIKNSNRTYEKDDARTVIFPLKVAADGQEIVRYRVRYSW